MWKGTSNHMIVETVNRTTVGQLKELSKKPGYSLQISEKLQKL